MQQYNANITIIFCKQDRKGSTMRTFFQGKMNKGTTTCMATYSQTASFGHVIGLTLSTALLVLIFVMLLANILAARITMLIGIIGVMAILSIISQRGKPLQSIACN